MPRQEEVTGADVFMQEVAAMIVRDFDVLPETAHALARDLREQVIYAIEHRIEIEAIKNSRD